MKSAEVKRFEPLNQRHLKMLKLQGKSKSTIDACRDRLTQEQLEDYSIKGKLDLLRIRPEEATQSWSQYPSWQ